MPGKSHGQRSLAGYSPWGHRESNMTEHGAHTHAHTHTKETKMTDLKSTETQKSRNGPCAVMQGQGLSGAQPAALSPVPTAARGMEKHCTSPAASGLKAGRKITP